jgi:hypothetical protein
VDVNLEDVKNYLRENKHLLINEKNKFTAETFKKKSILIKTLKIKKIK